MPSETDPNQHATMQPDLEALVEAWVDRGTSVTSIWIMLLCSACSIAHAVGKTPEDVCELVTRAWRAANAGTAVADAGGVGKKGEA